MRAGTVAETRAGGDESGARRETGGAPIDESEGYCGPKKMSENAERDRPEHKRSFVWRDLEMDVGRQTNLSGVAMNREHESSQTHLRGCPSHFVVQGRPAGLIRLHAPRVGARSPSMHSLPLAGSTNSLARPDVHGQVQEWSGVLPRMSPNLLLSWRDRAYLRAVSF